MGIAAIAAGKLPDSFRTRQISSPAFLIVLSCASTWELRIAAMSIFLLENLSEKMVFVSSLDLKEFRGIKELKEPLEFAKFNVLIGRNNSGIDVLLKILDTELESKDCSLILLQKTADDILLHKRLTLEELEDFVISNQDPRLLPDLLKL